jgi:predicted secreted acid phosphatase
MTSQKRVVFLLDLDDTLLDNDTAQDEYLQHKVPLRPTGGRALLDYFPGAF